MGQFVDSRLKVSQGVVALVVVVVVVVVVAVAVDNMNGTPFHEYFQTWGLPDGWIDASGYLVSIYDLRGDVWNWKWESNVVRLCNDSRWNLISHCFRVERSCNRSCTMGTFTVSPFVGKLYIYSQICGSELLYCKTFQFIASSQ